MNRKKFKEESKKMNKLDRTTSFLLKRYRKNTRVNEIYGNCRVYHPDGSLMFLCLEKKANWYLNKTDDVTGEPLAKEIRHINPIINAFMNLFNIKPNGLRVQLLFEPKSKGNDGDKYSLSKKENKCVVTGSKELESLTTHHITPYCYRKYLPDEYKSANSHDVVPIINDKHYEYEKEADKLKNKIAKKYNAPIEGSGDVDHKLFYAIKSAIAIHSNGEKMPKTVLHQHKEKIREYSGQKRVTQKLIDTLRERKYTEATDLKSHGQIVAEKLVLEGPEAIQEFVEMWRNHFIEHAKPKYMPKHWSVDRPASRLEN